MQVWGRRWRQPMWAATAENQQPGLHNDFGTHLHNTHMQPADLPHCRQMCHPFVRPVPPVRILAEPAHLQAGNVALKQWLHLLKAAQ